MINIGKKISEEIKRAFDRLPYSSGLKTNDNLWKVYSNGRNGKDFCFRGLVGLSKMLGRYDIVKSSIEIGNDIVEKLDLNTDKFSVELTKDSIFVNISKEGVESYLKSYMIKDHLIKSVELENRKNILVDFSSPNIAKDMHVGHLRSTIIGDTICRLLELRGHNVHRVNHIGDFGLQFGMIIQKIFDDGLNLDSDGVTVSDLQEFYADSKKRFDADPDFKNRAYQRVVELQNGNPRVVKAWEFIKDVSRIAYNEIYDRLNVNLTEVGESFYQPFIPSLVKELEIKGLLINEEGRKIIRVEGFKVPLTVIKSDGGFTYDTTDLAALKYRLVDLGMDSVYYVVDVGQSTHFKLLFEVAKLAGWIDDSKDVRHIGFGLVLGEDGTRFRSRDGDTVKLVDLLDKAVDKTELVVSEKGSDFEGFDRAKIVKNIAYGAVKYADLSGVRTNNYKFSFDKMLSFESNTAVYLLYAYVRIVSVKRKAEQYLDGLSQEVENFKISTTEEENLCKSLLNFPEILDRVEENFHFNTLSEYLYRLSKVFHTFFKNCRCLNYSKDKETIIRVDYNRLLLCDFTSRVMAECFNILNIKTVEKM